MSRMKIALGVLAASSLLLAGCASDTGDKGGSADGGTVTFTGWGGTGQEAIGEAWFPSFTEESGIEVVQDEPVSIEKLKLMVDNGNISWDVIQYGLSIPGGVEDNPMLEDIDCSIVPCDDFDGALKVYKQAVPMLSFSYVVAYNNEIYKKESEAPQNYADFFDTKKFPGLRMVGIAAEGWMGLIEAALIADGVDRDDLYPLDVDRALEFLDPIKDDLVVMTDESECINLVSTGEAVMGMCYNGRSATAQMDGLPIGISWGQQVIMSNYLHIVKGSPNAENAQKLVAHITSPEYNGDLSEYIAYGTSNPKATNAADSKYADYVPSSHLGTGDNAPIYPDSKWWAQNKADVVAKVIAWVQG